ncbi:hypothetical protein BDV97DRAFT_377453 [Delphinella strobiligena]|nr:hypothetical protein BDV97DRAFT_377453 [Delphinella strobiligena]
MATLDTLKQSLRQRVTAMASSQTQPLSEAQYSAGFAVLLQGPGRKTYQNFIIPQLALLLAPFFESHSCISILEVGPGPESVLSSLPVRLRQKTTRYAAFEPNNLFATRLEESFCSAPKTTSPLPCLESSPDIHRVPFGPDSSTSTSTSADNKKFNVILFCHSIYTDDNEALDCFAAFIVGFVMQDSASNKAIQARWREVCRSIGCCEEACPHHLFFSSLHIMASFTQHAFALPELTAQLPALISNNKVKNRKARFRHPASILRLKEIRYVQHLSIVSGGHSDNCVWSYVVALDISAFNKIHILAATDEEETVSPDSSHLVVVEAGCKSGDVVSKTIAAGLTVPMGSCGIGHLACLYSLTCNAIIGAVVLLWALKGAGTNFGVVISVTFKACIAPTYLVRNWYFHLSDNVEAQLKLSDFDRLVARNLPRHCSVDTYLYSDKDELRLGVTMFESCITKSNYELPMLTPKPMSVNEVFGQEDNSKAVDSVGLFETEMYMSGMHGGHGGGKTSSFKRCLFLKRIGAMDIANILVAAVETRPSPLCYLHLLQGGGAVGDVADNATAFGCRDWDFACVVTGVWPLDQDRTEIARAAVMWVYTVARDLLPLSRGAYSADLGPDPRDVALAAKAFGPNLSRLARLKQNLDPGNVLAFACPLVEAPTIRQKLIILVISESCAGKNYCANIWVSASATYSDKSLKARTVSISDVTKREYAVATGADLERLLQDRAYNEQHRPNLSRYFHEQVRQRPGLLEEHFLDLVDSATDADVLFIIGMRDVAPVAALSHLVLDCCLLEVSVKASMKMRRARGGCYNSDEVDDNDRNINNGKDGNSCPTFIFNNATTGRKAAERFFEHHLHPFFHEDLQQLSNIVRLVPNFPRQGIEFRDTLFTGDWTKVDVVVSCETGSFVYAPALAMRVGILLALIREAGKLPPPTISVGKSSSYISSSAINVSSKSRIEMGRNVVPRGATVVIVDDVLATGNTLCAVLQLLDEAGVDAEDVKIMVVAEFPVHRGRELLRRRGFGKAHILSLLVLGGT